MDSTSQFAPHPTAAFEGYYSNFTLLDGARIILIICSVRNAKTRPHMISFTYCPANYTSRAEVYQKEIWVDYLHMLHVSSEPGSFVLDFPCGSMQFSKTVTVYEIKHLELRFHAEVRNEGRVSWVPGGLDSPEGALALLPLPMHWQVYSLGSPASVSWNFRAAATGEWRGNQTDKKAHVHQEKNWATSFPKAHIWIQARDRAVSSTTIDDNGLEADTNLSGRSDNTGSGISIAGGPILGVEAYLLSYHPSVMSSPTTPSGQLAPMSTRPPLSTLILPFLPARLQSFNPTRLTTDTTISYPTRTISLTFLTSIFPLRKVCVTAHAPEATFFPLSAPFPEGHRPNFLVQSMRAIVHVQTFEIDERFGVTLPLLGWRMTMGTHWKCIEDTTFENAGLEFGGQWYGDRGA